MTEVLDSVRTDDRRCERCGRFGVVTAGEPVLCADCHQLAGACCPEFGGDDLTSAPRDCGRAEAH